MRFILSLLAGFAGLPLVANAQDLTKTKPGPSTPLVELPSDPRPRLPAELTPENLLPAQAHEVKLVARLRGVIFISDPAGAATAVPAAFSGVDFSAAPLLNGSNIVANTRYFINQPASLPSLSRLAQVARLTAQEKGEAFVVAYVPPQDLTDGVVRVVVRRAKLDGEIAIEGAEYFSKQQYGKSLALHAGDEIAAGKLDAAVEMLNQNPFRHVVLAASPGHVDGTTRLALRVDEQRPWRATAGYSNTGTRVTGEDRVSVGGTWGNALWRGDVLGYNFSADPEMIHSLSHSANYTTILPGRHALTVFGAWSRIESEMPVPLTQVGHSWQVGTRLSMPLRALRPGWKQNLSFSADFKASDNTLEFATIPITNNVTHIVQFGATYGVTGHALGGQNSASLSGYASLGGLSANNHGRFFEAARYGAKSEYAYATLALSHQHPIARGFSWNASAQFQAASGALLGSEQLNGGGSGAVRGYRESSAFGDYGVLVTNELHAPGIPVFKGNDALEGFVFVDVASLGLNVDHESTDLRSAGLGVNYQWRRYVNLRVTYGRQLKQLDRSTEHGRLHFSASLTW